MLFPFLAVMQVMFAGETFTQTVEERINQQIQTLDNSLDSTRQFLDVKDIKFVTPYKAYILYEIKDK